MKKIIITGFIIIAIFISFTAYRSSVDNKIAKINDATVQEKLQAAQREKLQVAAQDKSKVAATNINQKKQVVINNPTVRSKNKIIEIDPGHADKPNLTKEQLAPGSAEMKIMDGGGAQGIVTKTPEYVVNMKVALKLKLLLEAKGYIVKMTKTSNAVSLGNIARATIGNNDKANLVIRIHADSSDNGQVIGASMLVPMGINSDTKRISSESKRCGNIVLDTLVKEVGMKDRGVAAHSDMTGFNWSTVPVILVEMGFLSNVQEDENLSNNVYEDKLAKGLADGIDLAEN